ncbi:MAG: TonB-dependent receptor [Betaproteobacteria bacterium HGW-Betaproteobacteria-7]|jgi:iron complex outermembrane receptor protein|nr:MAG: TonB-dependent receptor [Betaproteobacteria bacterium HGW-Betaproteobacteria-7]
MTNVFRMSLSALALAFIALPVGAESGSVDLTAFSLEDLLETRITGAAKYEQKQSEVAAAVSVITRDEIKAFGWRTLDQALASLPGLHLSYDRQYSSLGTRGIGLPGDFITRVLVAINGNRVNDAVYDAGTIGRDFPVDMDLIERIEFIAGPGGAIYGQNAMFGVVNIITRDGAMLDGGELAAGWQSAPALREGRVSWGKRLDNGTDVLLSVSGMRARGDDLSMAYPGAGPGGSDVAGRALGQDGERDGEFMARLAHGPWSADFIASDRRKDDPTAAFFADALASGHYQRDAYRLAQLHYQDNFAADTVNVLGRLFHGRQRYTSRYHYAGVVNLARGESDWYGGEVRLLYTGIRRHKLAIGLEVQHNSRIEQSNDDRSTPGLDLRISDSGSRTGLYVQDEWRFADDWTAVLGLRVDRGSLAPTRASPRAALIWQASPQTAFKVLYGRAHRAPNAYERDYDDGISQIANPGLRGETVDTLELLADHRLARDFSLRTSIYQWRLRDIITLNTDALSGLTQYQSGDSIDARGVEVSLARSWSSGVRLRGSVAYQHLAYADGRQLENAPRWLGRLNVIYPLPWLGLRLGYELQYEGRRKTLDGSMLDAYALSHVNLVADKWLRGMEVALGVRNLFGQRYHHPGADSNWQNRLEQDGRNVMLSVGYRF